MVNVLIVEDQRMMRETMEYYIRQSENYCLAASVANASYAEACCAGSPIDLILMDICTEDNASGFAATEKIKARFPHIKVIIVTSLLDYDCIKTARKVGADSIWFKDASREELMAVVDRTVNGESVFPDRMPEVSVGETKSCDFTDAEVRVLRLLVEGMTYAQMASVLGVSPDTVKTQVKSMLSKTGFQSKTKLAAVVTSKKLIVNGF